MDWRCTVLNAAPVPDLTKQCQTDRCTATALSFAPQFRFCETHISKAGHAWYRMNNMFFYRTISDEENAQMKQYAADVLGSSLDEWVTEELSASEVADLLRMVQVAFASLLLSFCTRIPEEDPPGPDTERIRGWVAYWEKQFRDAGHPHDGEMMAEVLSELMATNADRLTQELIPQDFEWWCDQLAAKDEFDVFSINKSLGVLHPKHAFKAGYRLTENDLDEYVMPIAEFLEHVDEQRLQSWLAEHHPELVGMPLEWIAASIGEDIEDEDDS